MGIEELLQHVLDNVANGRPWGYGLDRDVVGIRTACEDMPLHQFKLDRYKEYHVAIDAGGGKFSGVRSVVELFRVADTDAPVFVSDISHQELVRLLTSAQVYSTSENELQWMLDRGLLHTSKTRAITNAAIMLGEDPEDYLPSLEY